MEKVNMILYDHNQNILDQSGIGLEYSHFLGALYNESGHYEMCFLKNTTEQTEIHFEVEKHEEGEAEMHAGKEEINKLSRRISSFLVDIKKLSWEYKEVLTQHNQRHNKLAANEESNYWLYLIKFTAMLLIMVIQIMIVRKIYQWKFDTTSSYDFWFPRDLAIHSITCILLDFSEPSPPLPVWSRRNILLRLFSFSDF